LTVEVRLARPDEYHIAADLTVNAYTGDGLVDSDAEYVAELGDAAGRAREAELLVAVDDSGTVLGTVTYCPPGSAWHEVGGDEDGEFRMLAVAPQARGRGVGRLLVEACIERTAALGLSSIKICSLPTMLAAHRLYRALGFRRAPELDWSPVSGVTLWGFVRSESTDSAATG
jgi:ribosomal protein S18 acetylase RimI-like enzyme